MRKTTVRSLGKELVAISAEARPGLAPAEAMEDLFRRLEGELETVGLSLDETIRTRLWARDRAGRQAASTVRVEILSGRKRSASSSFICPEHFESDATVALDLLAMRPPSGAGDKTLREYEPPIAPPRFLVWDGLVVLSGVTSEIEGIDAQLGRILPAIEGSLAAAGTGWDRVVNVDCFVHRSLPFDPVQGAIRGVLPETVLCTTFCHVDGYSHPAKLCEVEVTARL